MADKILVVDDEPSIVELVVYNLEQEGFEAITAADGAEALRLIDEEKPDLVILDVMLPGIDGFEVLRMVRRQLQLPVVMLTARKEEVDRVVGLEIGADDYITKPFSPRELVARVKAVLRRAGQSEQEDREAPIRRGPLVIDPARHEVTVDADPVQLTNTEFRLLHFLAKNDGLVFSREQLLDRVWGDAVFTDPRTVDVHIRHLRQKVEEEPSKPRLIETVRGVGYRFREETKQR